MSAQPAYERASKACILLRTLVDLDSELVLDGESLYHETRSGATFLAQITEGGRIVGGELITYCFRKMVKAGRVPNVCEGPKYCSAYDSREARVIEGGVLQKRKMCTGATPEEACAKLYARWLRQP